MPIVSQEGVVLASSTPMVGPVLYVSFTGRHCCYEFELSCSFFSLMFTDLRCGVDVLLKSTDQFRVSAEVITTVKRSFSEAPVAFLITSYKEVSPTKHWNFYLITYRAAMPLEVNSLQTLFLKCIFIGLTQQQVSTWLFHPSLVFVNPLPFMHLPHHPPHAHSNLCIPSINSIYFHSTSVLLSRLL